MELKQYIEQELQPYLNKKMNNNWEIDTLCHKLLRTWARDNGYTETDFSSSQDKSYIYLKYKGYCLGYVKFKKKKIDTHHAWYGSYCDWAYASFIIFRNASDTAEQIMNFDQEIMAKEDAKALLNKRGKELLLEVMARYNIDKHKAVDILSAAVRAQYSL